MSQKPEVSKHLTKTSWKPGISANPNGRPKAGFQSFKDRLAYWLETKTYKDIQDLVENEKKWGKLLSIDAMVARRIHEACQKDKTGDFVAVLDRLLGKPMQAVEATLTHALADRLDQAEKLLTSDPAPMIEGEALVLQSVLMDNLEPVPEATSQSFEDLI